MFSEELVEIKGDPFIIDLMYAKPENMMQCPIYEKIGFGNRAFVSKDMWEILQKLIPILQQRKQKLKICDAYRPPIAHNMMLEIIPMPGFFARCSERSQHCHATAIDCCLCDEDGKELNYPTQVDAYKKEYALQILDGKSDTFMAYLKTANHHYEDEKMKEEMMNRDDLCALMQSIGLEALPHEWWHYNLPNGIMTPVVEWGK